MTIGTEIRPRLQRQIRGFETDIHGLVKDGSNGAVRYYVDCVAN